MDTTADKTRPAPCLAEDIYTRLREEIVLGRLRPNELLVEADLADRLQVSRTPVRETLLRLAADGLIVSRRRRWIVYEHTPDEIRSIYEVRMALEGFAARLACARISDEQLSQIAMIFEGSDANLTLLCGERRVQANNLFHSLIVKAAGSPQLTVAAERTRLYYFNTRIASLYDLAEAEESHQQHLELIKALRDRDGDYAEQVARQHVETALDVILRKIDR